MTDRAIDEQMRAYYERRAAEYEDRWLGTGLFARRERPGRQLGGGAVLHAGRWLVAAAAPGGA